MPAYVVQVRRESLGAGRPSFETVCAFGENESAVLQLVKTALRLEDESVEVLRTLPDDKALELGLKPYQVKHMP
jgi:hypothetical protein